MKFSVLISIYWKERPEYLKECIVSITNQSLVPSELVIVKDGPLTNELEITLNDILQNCSIPVVIVTLEINKGLGVALQKGLLACNHEYVARMDADDICFHSRFKKQIELLKERPDVDVLGSWISEFNETTDEIQGVKKVPLSNREIYEYAKLRNPLNHMSVIFKKSKVLAAGGYMSFQYMEDYYLWFRMMMNNCVFWNIQESLVYVRSGNNMLRRRSGWSYFLVEKKFFDELKQQKFISSIEYLYVLAIRMVNRLAPISFIKAFYKFFLRS